ncbi:MAG: carbohydrate binding family 9 domain-containing protein [Acidobacteria bacterium]|nr:carbohydrate binding family 9 domain-containing protein [Acidobacteriota bacterium]MCL5289377.1 carbohydrate binding family 9 domain-containing protein [Acidobacteriota bacterium]
MSSFRRSFWGFLLVALAASFAGAQTGSREAGANATVKPALPEPSSLHIPRVSRAPKIGDFLAGGTPVGVRVTGFRQREPGDGTPVTQPTTAYLSYDDKNLYVAFICTDEPGKVRARMAKREDIVGDDRVGVSLDTFHDGRRHYYFWANPLGIQLDGVFTEGQGLDSSFDTLWHSEGRLTRDGYVVWLAIPFKSLRFSNADMQTWGMALGREIIRQNEVSFWPYITPRKEGTTNQFALLEGLEDISPSRNMQFIPYGAFSSARFLDRAATGGPDFRSKAEGRGGLDAKIVLKDSFTVDVALNPDFSQVESDEPQVTVNQRFEVFFPEKRPFFIENAGFFRTPTNLFFSRRIADPQFGVRVTGKTGPWTIGAFGMDDRQATSAFVPSGSGPGIFSECDPLDDGRAGIGVFRVQREFASQSTVGVFFSSRDFSSCSNRVVSLDTRIKLNPNWVLAGQIYRSFTRRVDGSHRTGPGAFLDLTHRGRHFTYAGRYQDRSPDFRAHLGFVSRVDVRFTEQFLGYYWRPEGKLVQYYGPTVDVVINGNRAGDIQDWVVDASFDVGLRGQTYFSLRRNEAFELFQGRGFRKHISSASASTGWLKWLAVSGQMQIGAGVNYFPGSSLPSFLADSRTARFGLTLRPMPRFRVDETYIYSRLATREGSTPAGFAPATPIFNNHILRSKVNYQFTRELSLRAILDYNSVLPNAQLVALGRTKALKADLLLTYLINPGTALYIGYSDLYQNLEIDSVSAAPLRTLRTTGSPSTSTGRQFFVKLSYLFRF